MNRTTKIFCSSLLFLLLMMEAKAQTIMGGNVTVSDLAVSRSEDKLFVSMDIDVSALSVKSNREVILTPRLSGEGNELNLPSVMIAGRNRYYHHLRNGLCTDDVMLSLKNRHKAQRKAKFYINKCRSASCMQSGWKRTPA